MRNIWMIAFIIVSLSILGIMYACIKCGADAEKNYKDGKNGDNDEENKD